MMPLRQPQSRDELRSERPGPMASPVKPEGQSDQIKAQLIQLLTQAKQLAQQNGIDWNEIMGAISSSKIQTDVPRPPSPPVGMPMQSG